MKFRYLFKKIKQLFIKEGTREEVRSQRSIRLRSMIAFPVMTALLVLGLGLVTLDLLNRELLGLPHETLKMVEVEAVIEKIRMTILFFGALAIATGVALAFTITLPIRQLTASTRRIAEGDLTRSIRVASSSEIAQLEEAFNLMVASLNKYLLRSFSGGVITVNKDGIITSFSSDAEIILCLLYTSPRP